MKREILTYYDLVNIKASENNERLVSLNQVTAEIVCQYEKKDMFIYTGQEIFVRETVAKMLLEASQLLKKINSNFRLKVVYGYRHPDVQRAYFEKRKADIIKKAPELSSDDLSAKTHLFVAAPDVAGHIVGGAVDLTIITNNSDLDMGTSIADYLDDEKIQTFSESINEDQRKNRMLLHDLMKQVGFAPFYGEWWHFSYGDKEWAAFYKKSRSIYSSIDFRK